MRLKSALMRIAVTLAFGVFSPTIARADLLGSEVTAVLFYPTETDFCNMPGFCSSPVGPVLVTSGTPPEFPAGTAVGDLAFDGSLAISGSQIIWTATMAEPYTASRFNGFNLMFTGASTITDVTVDPASTILPVPFSGFPQSSSPDCTSTGATFCSTSPVIPSPQAKSLYWTFRRARAPFQNPPA